MTLPLQLVLIAIGGALGACMRFGASVWANKVFVGFVAFPVGTLFVNVIGSALMAMCYGLVVEKGVLPESIKPFFMVGFLGAFTTFSSFSLEAIALFEQGLVLNSVSYVVANVVLSLLFFVVGLAVVRLVF